MLKDAGLSDVTVGVGARKAGDPFTVLVASASKPGVPAADDVTPPKPREGSRTRRRAAKE